MTLFYPGSDAMIWFAVWLIANVIGDQEPAHPSTP